ncbi:MAG: FecCD family ABC transporter permease [Pleomorphochaeta sp.]
MNLNKNRNKIIIIFLIILGIILVTLSITKGSVKIPINEVIAILFNQDSVSKSHKLIILELRIPRTISAIMVGMSLAISGAVFQTLFKNPLTEPYLLGISSGAALGVAIASVFGFVNIIGGIWGTFSFAFVFAILTALLIFTLAGKNRSSLTILLLSGLAINFFLSALNSLLLYFNKDKLENIIYWQMGSFNLSSYEKIIVTMPIMIILIIVLLSKTKELDVLLLSDDTATSIGLDVKKQRIRLLLITTLLTSICVGLAGVIGFIGLIIPHIVKLLFGVKHKNVLPLSLYLGAIFTLLCDILSRTLISNTEIPIGIITALFGAPFFLYILRKTKVNAL